MEKISLIMPVFNGEPFIQQSIQSILDQTYKDFELIVINDGSIDDTEKIVDSFKDPRIIYKKQENQGKSIARNNGLKEASGDYIVFHDADDLSLPCRLAMLRNHLNNQPQIDFVHSDMLLIDDEGKPIGYWSTSHFHPSRYARFFLKVGTPFNNGTMMIRKSALREELLDHQLSVGEDTEFIERALQNKYSVHVALPLLQYRRHSANESNNVDETTLSKHVCKILGRYSIFELIPECNWGKDNEEDCLCQAYAILFLFLFRRGFAAEAQSYFFQAKNKARNPFHKFFLFSMVHLAANNPETSLEYLDRISNPDHIVYQYRGECYARLKNWNFAYDCFMKAIQLRPDYEEPLDHLKALGCGIGYHSIDPSYYMYRF